MIGGFIVSGETDKTVVLRAIGPSLAKVGVAGALADPLLELYDSGGILIAQNYNRNSLPPEEVPSGFEPAIQTNLSSPRPCQLAVTLPSCGGLNGVTGVPCASSMIWHRIM